MSDDFVIDSRRCKVCDRPRPRDDLPALGECFIMGDRDCQANAVDWRARADGLRENLNEAVLQLARLVAEREEAEAWREVDLDARATRVAAMADTVKLEKSERQEAERQRDVAYRQIDKMAEYQARLELRHVDAALIAHPDYENASAVCSQYGYDYDLLFADDAEAARLFPEGE